MTERVGTAAASWSRLTAAVADQVVVTAVEGVHRAVSDSVYRWLGPLGRPVQRYTDAVSAGAYRAVRLGLRGAGEVAAAACQFPHGRAAATADGEATPTASPPPSRAAIKARAIAQGVLSPELLSVAPAFEEELSLRYPGRPGPVAPAELAAAVPMAGPHLVVFVHGLVDTEQVWFPTDERAVCLPAAVEASGATPLLVRYATGRTIERNGRDLDAAMEAVVTSWPVPLASLTLVGHSMGGLLARAACAAAVARGARWLDRLGDLLYLGTPHLGSWLEKVANVTSWTLRRTSRHAAPIGALLDGRSQGIKDLRFGTTETAAWPEGRVDGLLTGRPVDAPWLVGARHHLVVGRLHPHSGHPLNAVLGDALVRSSSATGAGRWRRIEGTGPARVTTVDASHVRLPRDAEVASVLSAVLAERRRAG
ncbi:MAG: hypothetical protein EA387_12025 [Nitriliruptor sp.]|nr:MAG: hypothetical protein EA387_12025 [Nitriliruptor sp.]